MKVVHIIPTYNEAENIGLFIAALKKVSRKYPQHKFTILVVDDNSPDGTGEIVRNLAKKDYSIDLLSGPKEGLGKAMIRGLKYAVKTLHADVVIPNEADFAFDTKYIAPALKMIESGFDVVVGSRHVGDGRIEGWTLIRRFNHWIANTVFAVWVAGDQKVTDHNGAFRVVRVKNVQEKIDFKDFPSGFSFFHYWLYKLTEITPNVVEIPITYKFRTRGQSKVSFNPKYFRIYVRDAWEYIIISFKIRAERYMIRV